jgi:hypothetical protein
MPRGKRAESKTPTVDYDAARQIDIDRVEIYLINSSIRSVAIAAAGGPAAALSSASTALQL